jgi:Phage integrase, N-terminal SAM-like domain
VNSDRIPWDCPSIVAGFSSYTRKGIAMSKLRKRMIQDMRLAGFVEGTEQQYLRAVRQLTAFYRISPDQLSERNVEKYILYVRDELGVARGTFVPMFFGLKFFYVNTLGYDWPLFTKKKSASRTSGGCPSCAVTRIAAA